MSEGLEPRQTAVDRVADRSREQLRTTKILMLTVLLAR